MRGNVAADALARGHSRALDARARPLATVGTLRAARDVFGAVEAVALVAAWGAVAALPARWAIRALPGPAGTMTPGGARALAPGGVVGSSGGPSGASDAVLRARGGRQPGCCWQRCVAASRHRACPRLGSGRVAMCEVRPCAGVGEAKATAMPRSAGADWHPRPPGCASPPRGPNKVGDTGVGHAAPGWPLVRWSGHIGPLLIASSFTCHRDMLDAKALGVAYR